MKSYTEPESSTKGSLFKRKDFIGVDHLANSHPNRTYYYRKNEDENDIINTCTRKLQTDPNNIKALFLRGSTYSKKSLYQQSIADFDVLLRIDPNHADGLYCRAMSLSKVNQPERAIDDFTKVLALKPDHYKAAFHRAACYNLLGRLLEAIEDYNFALMKDENEAQGGASGGSIAPSYQGDDFSMNDLDASRLTYQNDGDSSPPFVLHSDRNRAISSATLDGSGSDSGNISPLSIRSSGKFSNYHQYSPAATPTVTNNPFPLHLDRNNSMSQQFALAGRSAHSASAISLDTMATANGHPSESQQGPNRRPINPSTPGRPAFTSSTPLMIRPANGNTALSADGHVGSTSRISISNNNNSTSNSSSGNSNSNSNSSNRNNEVTAANHHLAEEHHSRGYQLRKQNDFSGAVLEYSKAIEVEPTHFRALFNRGFAHDKLGLFDLAIADYTRALEMDPSNAFSFYNRGISLDKKGSLDAALQDFTTAINLQPKNAEFYQNRAFCLRRLGKFPAAVEDYTASLKLSPNNFKSLHNRAMCFEKLDKLEAALDDCNAALRVQPTHAPCLLVKANILERFNRLPEALECLNAALANGSDAYATLSARGKLLRNMGIYNEAIRDLSSALEMQPGEPTLLSTRGVCQKALNNYTAAIQDFSAVVAQDPQNVAALNHRGFCYRKLEDYEHSIADYTKCIQLSPANLRAYNNRAYIYAGINRYREALADYNTVLAQDPNSVHAYHNRGMLYDKMGMIDQAIADFSKVLELEPQHGQNDNNNSNGISQQSMSNRQAAQLALEALHLQLQEKNAQPAFAPPPLRGPTTIELGRQNSESSLGRLLSAQALLSQVPASAGINSRQPGAKTSINSISGSIQAQNGTFYPPRGGAPSSSSSAAVALSEARSAVPARLLDRAQPQPAQSVQSGQVVNKASPTPVDTAAKGTSAVSSSVSPPSPPSQEQQQLVLERQASSGGPDLSNRLNEVSNLLKGFGTPFIPAVRNSSVGSSVGNTNVNANDNSRGQRSTTPTSHLVNRRIAASAEGTTTPAAGQNKPNFYRAPVPVQSVAKEDDVPPKSASALLSLPVPAPSPAQTPMRPLPAAIVPSRYQQQSSVLSIDTSAMLSTPSGRPSSVPFAESSGTVSTTRTGPVSAATFLNSLPKPAAPGPPSSANRISVSTGAGLSSFSPRLLDQQGGLNGSSAATPLQGKFSQPQVYSK